MMKVPNLMLDGIILLWFAEVFASLVFVASAIARTPESLIMKWGFVTLFTGPIGLVLYIFSCREPLPESTQTTYGLAGAACRVHHALRCCGR